MVPDAGAAFCAAIAPELEPFVGLHDQEVGSLFPGVFHQFAVVVSWDTVDVFMGDPVSCGDERICLSDEFSVLDDFIALVDIDQRDLMAIGDGFFRFDGFDFVSVTVCDSLAGGHFPHAGDDVVFRVHQ